MATDRLLGGRRDRARARQYPGAISETRAVVVLTEPLEKTAHSADEDEAMSEHHLVLTTREGDVSVTVVLDAAGA